MKRRPTPTLYPERTFLGGLPVGKSTIKSSKQARAVHRHTDTLPTQTIRIMPIIHYQDPNRARYKENRQPNVCRLCFYFHRHPPQGLTPDGICKATKACLGRQHENAVLERQMDAEERIN